MSLLHINTLRYIIIIQTWFHSNSFTLKPEITFMVKIKGTLHCSPWLLSSISTASDRIAFFLILDTDMNVVIVRPKFTSYVVNVGQKICLECNTKPSTAEAHQFISWNVSSVTPGVKTSRMPNGTLCIDEVTAGHTGSYKCKVGAYSLTYTLSVRGKGCFLVTE